MRAFVVAGSPVAREPVGIRPRDGDFVVAADLGARHALDWGWPLHLLVGDLDSLPATQVERLVAAGVKLQQVPGAKDETDTELALAAALARGPQRVIICGALGGRADHLLANVFLLAGRSLAGVDVCLADGRETLRLLDAGRSAATLEIDGAAGDLVSLLPLGADAHGVTTRGLRYPLRAETLFEGEARGVSNVMAGERAGVTIARGRLLVIHQRMS